MPTPAMRRPANKSGLNEGPVIPLVISISSQPMVNGTLQRTIVNWRPLLSTIHPAMRAPQKLPIDDRAYKRKINHLAEYIIQGIFKT